MKYKPFRVFAVVGILAVTLAALPQIQPPAQAAPPDTTAAKAKTAVAKGLDYLRRVQEKDGSWGEYPATTALAVAAFLRNGRSEIKEPAVARGVQYLLGMTKPNGAIYSDANPAQSLPNYNTSLSLLALSLTHNPAYRPQILAAQKYLETSQFDEGEGVAASDPTYGGIGYGSKPDRPDLSNLQTALEALQESGASTSSPVWKKAIAFLQRVQNRRASNDQAWVKAPESADDGGFIYDSKGRSFSESGGKPQSYASMTYAGLKSYIYCGLTKDDPRAQSAWDWIRGHYSVTENPGMGAQSLYYYYHTMAKTLDVFNEKIVRDTKGVPHDWARELAAQLTANQRPDGSWYNDNARFWENQPPLVTSYTLLALSYCLKR